MTAPSPRIVLHVGSHKTGTSSLQKFLRENRPAAEAGGVRHLRGLSKSDGSELSHNLLALRLASGVDGEIERARDCIRAGLSDTDGIGTLFISSEEFNRYVMGRPGRGEWAAQGDFTAAYMAGDDTYWTRRAAFIDRVADTFRDHAVEIWVSLRRPDNFCMSMYQQVVRNRAYVAPIETFAESDFALFQYGRLLAQWARHFPVRVFVYEDLIARDGDAVAGLLGALGLDDLVPLAAGMPRVNTTSHPHTIEFLRRTNFFPLDKADLRKRIPRVSAALGWAPARSTVTLPPDRRRAINARFADDLAAIRDTYRVPTPGRDTLFDMTVDDPRPVYPGMDDRTYDALARALNLVDPIFP